MLLHLHEKIVQKYKSVLSLGKTYKNMSLYFEYKSGGEVLVLSLNIQDHKIYIYHRSKSFVEYLPFLLDLDKKFILNKHVFVLDVAVFTEADLVELMCLLLLKIDETLIDRNKLSLDMIITNFDKHEKELAGNYKDNCGNEVKAPLSLDNCKIQFLGKNNLVEIDSESDLKNVSLQFVGNDSKVRVGKKVSMFGRWRLGHGCSISIGDNVTSTSAVYMTCAEKTSISIGDDCMFATNVQIRTDDAHAIYDLKNGTRINPSQDIVIGNHVWLAFGVIILGGATIGHGSIVGASALVKGDFPDNCSLAGVPARVLKKNIFWERPNVLYFSEPSEYKLKDN